MLFVPFVEFALSLFRFREIHKTCRWYNHDNYCLNLATMTTQHGYVLLTGILRGGEELDDSHETLKPA